MQKSSYLSEHLSYNMLKGYYGIFANDAKNILPTAGLIQLFRQECKHVIHFFLYMEE